MIGNAVHNLLKRPNQLAWLRANPDRIAEAAEELCGGATLQITTRMALPGTPTSSACRWPRAGTSS